MDSTYVLTAGAAPDDPKEPFLMDSRSIHASLPQPKQRTTRSVHGSLLFPWLLSLLLFSLLVLLHQWMSEKHDQQCFWKPYELGPATREIPMTMKEVRFSGGLRIVDGVGLIREVDPTLPIYVGAPSSAIDDAWKELIYPLNVFITEQELEGNKEGTSPDPETGLYVAMPQGFHDLHCLNLIRQRIHLDYYVDLAQMNSTVLAVHIDHCIDSLRQSLMCTGDLTHIKTFWIEKRHRMMADFDNLHMCRDFDALKSWLRLRDAEDGSTWQASAARLTHSKR